MRIFEAPLYMYYAYTSIKCYETIIYDDELERMSVQYFHEFVPSMRLNKLFSITARCI